MTPHVGVEAIPKSRTLHPVAINPETTACRSISPVERPSRDNTTVPPLSIDPSDAENRATYSGSRPSPTMPRKPEMLRIRSVIKVSRE